jgi:hypothetical protein
MMRGGFLSANDRRPLTRLAQAGREGHRVSRRANAAVIFDQDWNCDRVAEAWLLDDDTVRSCYRADERDGVEGLKNFGYKGAPGHLSAEQEAPLKGERRRR